MTIKLYTHPECEPCKQVTDILAKQGNTVDGEEVKVVDLDTDEGFDEFTRDVLVQGASGVPSAYKDGQRCELILDDEALTISVRCPQEAPPSSAEPG